MGYFQSTLARDDKQNLKLLLAGRIDYIVADPFVIDYLIDQDDTISRSSVKFIEPAFKKNDLYFAISKRTVGWQQIQNRINEKLTAFEDADLLSQLQIYPADCRR